MIEAYDEGRAVGSLGGSYSGGGAVSGLQRRQRRLITALAAAAFCSLLITGPASAAALPLPTDPTGLPGVPLALTAGSVQLSTGLAVAELSNGANGPVLFTIGPCIPGITTSCSGVLTEILLTGNFKDDAGDPLYSDSAPASVSWTCNDRVCPPPADFVPDSSTMTELQVAEFENHPMSVSLRNPNGTYQPFAAAPACNGIDEAPLPTGTIDRQDTGGLAFCVDVGAISRGDMQCQTECSAWSGPLTLPVLFEEDPRFMGT